MIQLKWEYKVTNEDQLSEFGEAGWELVTALQHGEKVTCYFKRPKRTFTERITEEQKSAVASQLGERKDEKTR